MSGRWRESERRKGRDQLSTSYSVCPAEVPDIGTVLAKAYGAERSRLHLVTKAGGWEVFTPNTATGDDIAPGEAAALLSHRLRASGRGPVSQPCTPCTARAALNLPWWDGRGEKEPWSHAAGLRAHPLPLRTCQPCVPLI